MTRVLLISCIAGCLGLAGAAFKPIFDCQAVRVRAEKFLNEVEAGRLDAAYLYTTFNFQLNEGLKHFLPSVASPSSGPHPRSACRVNTYNGPTGPEAIFHTTLAGPRALFLTLILVKEEGAWKVDRSYWDW
jgi:hypothetical protein